MMDEIPAEVPDLGQQVSDAVAEALPDALDAAVSRALSEGGSSSLDGEAVGRLLDAVAAQTVAEVFILAVLLLLVGLVLSQIFTRRLAA